MCLPTAELSGCSCSIPPIVKYETHYHFGILLVALETGIGLVTELIAGGGHVFPRYPKLALELAQLPDLVLDYSGTEGFAGSGKSAILGLPKSSDRRAI